MNNELIKNLYVKNIPEEDKVPYPCYKFRNLLLPRC